MIPIEETSEKLLKKQIENSLKPFYMDIYKHNEVILKWIKSCQTAQQLDLFTKLITEFDATQFYNEINPFEVELTKRELLDAIIEQRVIVAGKREPMRLTPEFLLIPNELAICLSE